MATGGRKRKPAALRELHASRRRKHHQPEPPVQPIAEDATAPEELTPEERAYWDRYAPILAGAKVLTTADVETLADYCRACAAVVDRGEKYRAAVAASASAQMIKMLDAQQRGWAALKVKLAAELGLTAVSRTKVAWDKGDDGKPESALDKLRRQASEARRPVAVKA